MMYVDTRTAAHPNWRVSPPGDQAVSDTAPTHIDFLEAPAPRFTDDVYTQALAARDRAAGINRARATEPVAFAHAVKHLYERHALVGIIRDTFTQLAQERGHPVVYWFEHFPLALTADGFCDTAGHPLGDSVPLPANLTSIDACRELDAELTMLARAPERHVCRRPRIHVWNPRRGPMPTHADYERLRGYALRYYDIPRVWYVTRPETPAPSTPRRSGTLRALCSSVHKALKQPRHYRAPF